MPSSRRSEAIDLGGVSLLVTGGTGFVGRSLFDYVDESVRLHGTSDLRVCVLSREPAQFMARHPRYAKRPWLEFMRGDVTTFAAPPGEYSHVIHAAADTHRSGDQTGWIEQIVGGTRRTLDAAAASGARRFLLVSSGAVYGEQREAFVREDADTAPPTTSIASTYGQAKRLAEQLCTVCAEERGIETVIARCFAIIGAHIPLDGPYAMGDFLREATLSRPIVLRNGEAVRSYLDARDMAHWLFVLLTRGAPGEAYNVGSDKSHSLREVAQLVRDVVNPGGEVRVLSPTGPCTARGQRYVPSIDKARTLGLEVETVLDEAVLDAAEAIRLVHSTTTAS